MIAVKLERLPIGRERVPCQIFQALISVASHPTGVDLVAEILITCLMLEVNGEIGVGHPSRKMTAKYETLEIGNAKAHFHPPLVDLRHLGMVGVQE